MVHVINIFAKTSFLTFRLFSIIYSISEEWFEDTKVVVRSCK